MNVIGTVLAIYFFLGLIVLSSFLITKRIRQRLTTASYETMAKLAESGSYTGTKMAMTLTILALWLFWPVAIYGAVSSEKKDTDGNR